jgi:taurine-pyruvate aminotransferase
MISGTSSGDTLAAWDRAHLWHPLTQHREHQSLVLTRGQGAWVYDDAGRAYLDASAGLWCVAVGHGRAELAEAALAQMQALAFYPLIHSHPPAIRLAARLAEYLPHNPRVYFTNSGSEANETAFKVVRQYWKQHGQPGRYKILARDRAYHGSTLGALSATGQPERRRGYEPLAPGFLHAAAPYCYRCPFGQHYPDCGLACAEDFARLIEAEGPETVAAIIVEPIHAGGGVLVPPPDYLRAVSSIARRYDVKLIVDEVVTGFGRTGAMFQHQADGVTADVVTMAKGLASGYMPIGAACFTEELFDAFLGEAGSGRHLRHVNTFGGHPVATAVALANLDILEQERLPEQSRIKGLYLLDRLRDRLGAHPAVGDIRGRGLFVGIEVVAEADARTPAGDERMRAIGRALASRGILLGKTTDVVPGYNNIMIAAPPLVVSQDELDLLVAGLEAALDAVAG